MLKQLDIRFYDDIKRQHALLDSRLLSLVTVLLLTFLLKGDNYLGAFYAEELKPYRALRLPSGWLFFIVYYSNLNIVSVRENDHMRTTPKKIGQGTEIVFTPIFFSHVPLESSLFAG